MRSLYNRPTQPFPKPVALLLSSVMLAGLLTSCRSGNDSRSIETTNESAASEKVTEVAEPSSETISKKAERIYAELVEKYGEDYESCGEVVITEAKTCSEGGATGQISKENLNIEIVLDASGSMAGLVGGEEKMTVAKETLTEFVGGLPKKANVAMRVYGHLGSNSEQDRAKSCSGTELLYDFQPLDQAKFASIIASFNPTGWTPIAESLKQAGNDFSDYDAETNENVVYLISDGIETCDGDPVAAAQVLNQSDINTIVNVIAFDVNSEAAVQLREVAQAGGGEYIEASNRNDLRRILNQKKQSALRKHNCTFQSQLGAHNATAQSNVRHHNCRSKKAIREHNKVAGEALSRSNSGEFENEVYRIVSQLAREKRERMKPDREEYDRINREAKEEYNQVTEEAKEEYNRATKEAEEEYESAQ